MIPKMAGCFVFLLKMEGYDQFAIKKKIVFTNLAFINNPGEVLNLIAGIAAVWVLSSRVKPWNFCTQTYQLYMGLYNPYE